MFYPDQAQKHQIQFSLAVPEVARLQPQVKLTKRTPPAMRELAPVEVHFSGSQILIGLASAMGSIGLLVWAVVRLWLFGG